VFRARDKETGDIVALKKLKLDEEKNGFPITSLREVMALMVCRHENVVGVREIVVGDTLTQCVRGCKSLLNLTHLYSQESSS
jgi:cell division cycle 2-like protein